jgi:uncharacterized protein (TIGR03435 family)
VPTPEFAASFGRLAANHLWQSTAFAAVAVLLALALRAHARARYWLWLAASVKFLVPFSALAAIGANLGRWLLPATPVSRFPLVMEQIVQPFAPVQYQSLPVAASAPTASLLPALLLALWFCGFLAVLIYVWTRWRRVAAAVRSSTRMTEGREKEALWKVGQAIRLPTALRLVSSTAKLEPGVLGIFRPILWLPAGIGDRLDDAELESILAHELCHIRRRDNLFATIHMLVEAVFWFHPLVWWLGARLGEERERACDEEVVRMGGEPQVYAESILKVVEFYLASPVACAAGVTGGELKKRIEGIMSSPFTRKLSFGKKLLLATVALAAVAFPLLLGVIHAGAQTDAAALRFEVAAVHPGMDPGKAVESGKHVGTRVVGDRVDIGSATLLQLIMTAYSVKGIAVAGPDWIRDYSHAFDIQAKLPSGATAAQLPEMLRTLLEERFKLMVHLESKLQSGYALVVAPSGPKLQPSVHGNDAQGNASGQDKKAAGRGSIRTSEMQGPYGTQRVSVSNGILHMEYSAVTTKGLADMLVQPLGQPVVDLTDLKGTYNVALDFAQRDMLPSAHVASATSGAGANDVAAVEPPFASVFQAVEKLGLRLERRRVPVERLVIDHIERTPTEN